MVNLKYFHFFILIAVPIMGQKNCGQTPIKPNITSNLLVNKIVGGFDAIPYSWPWQILLCRTGYQDMCGILCGGSIISPHWVLTAGHCIYKERTTPGVFRVRAGIFNENENASMGMQEYRINKIYLHPDYWPDPDPQNDVALLELSTEIVYGDTVQPVCLPSEDSDYISEPNTAWATGWGTVSEKEYVSMTLKQVEVPFVNYISCKGGYPNRINVTYMVCAGAEGADTCTGDSGGPLVSNVNDAWYLFGVTSCGDDCGVLYKPGIYARVSYFCSWISTVTNGEAICNGPTPLSSKEKKSS